MTPKKVDMMLDEDWMHECIGENAIGDENYNSLRYNWEGDGETEYKLKLTIERVGVKEVRTAP